MWIKNFRARAAIAKLHTNYFLIIVIIGAPAFFAWLPLLSSLFFFHLLAQCCSISFVILPLIYSPTMMIKMNLKDDASGVKLRG